MIDWLNRLPDVAVFAVLVIPSVLAMVLASLLGHRYRIRFRKKPDESTYEIMDAFIAVASAAGGCARFLARAGRYEPLEG